MAPSASPLRARLFGSAWPATLTVLLPVSLWLAWKSGMLWAQGEIEGQPWFHPIPPRGAWIPFVHPPGYGEFMRAVAALSERLWITEGLLIFWSSGLATAALCLLFARSALVSAPFAVLASGLLVMSPASLRPFEHYPLSKLLVTGAALALIAGARGASNRMLGLGAALGLLTVMLHLNGWFLLAPLGVGLLLAYPERRREVAAAGAAMVGAFSLFAFPDILEVLAMGPSDAATARGVSLSNITYEWNSPWLWAPAALWLHPALHRTRRWALPLLGAVGAYVAVMFAMMARSLVIAGGYIGSHHYFELIDPAACLLAAGALGAAWEQARGRAARAGVAIAVAALLGSQLHQWAFGMYKLVQLAEYAG